MFTDLQTYTRIPTRDAESKAGWLAGVRAGISGVQCRAMDWLKEHEYLAAWIGVLLAVIALVPFREFRWKAIAKTLLMLPLLFGSVQMWRDSASPNSERVLGVVLTALIGWFYWDAWKGK